MAFVSTCPEFDADQQPHHILGWVSDPEQLAALRAVPVNERNTSHLYRLLDCNALQYCMTVDRFKDECDHLHLSSLNLHPSFSFLVAFLAVLLAKPLMDDASEAVIEEALLDHRLAAGAP